MCKINFLTFEQIHAFNIGLTHHNSHPRRVPQLIEMFHRSTAVKAEESANLILTAELIGVVGARRLKSRKSNPASADVQGAAQVWRRGITPV